MTINATDKARPPFLNLSERKRRKKICFGKNIVLLFTLLDVISYDAGKKITPVPIKAFNNMKSALPTLAVPSGACWIVISFDVVFSRSGWPPSS